MRQVKHLQATAIGCIGLFLIASPALAAPRKLQAYCVCHCSGEDVLVTPADGGVSIENCRAITDVECLKKNGLIGFLNCGGEVVYAFPTPPVGPNTNPIQGFDTLVNEVESLKVVDLLPLPAWAGAFPEGGGSSLCRLSPDLTKLQVQVYNQGTLDSLESTTRVEFANNNPIDMPTPALVKAGSAVVEFPIPASCYDTSNNCHFRIGADFTSAVAESDEVNNNAFGVCGASIE